MAFFEVNGLHVAYGKKEIVKGVSFSINQGEFCALLGLNGSGKTTTLHSICGFLPMTGEITIEGRNSTSLNERQRALLISFIPQVCGLQDGRTVLEAVLMGFNPKLGLFSSPGSVEKQLARAALARIGIEAWERRDFGSLSQGQKQLVIIARCIVQDSPVMLMDEPDSALDFVNRHVVLGKIRDIIKEENRCGLITLHDPNFAMTYCDKLILLKNGVIAYEVDMHNTNHNELQEKLSTIYGDIDLIEKNGHFLMGKVS